MTIIKLTGGMYDHDIYVNVENITTIEERSGYGYTELGFVGNKGTALVKETPRQIIAKVRRAVGRLAPADAEDAAER